MNRHESKLPMPTPMPSWLLSIVLIILSWPMLPTLAHEDHAARHGGFVMMFLQMHFELVIPPEGGVEIYYSDAMRMEMPASVVSDVAVEIERSGPEFESVLMQISDSGDSWLGNSTPVTDPATIVRVAFLFQGEPFVLDIPVSVFPQFDHAAMTCHNDCAD